MNGKGEILQGNPKKNSKKLSKQDRKLTDKCPFMIPDHATAKDNNKPTYKQKIFTWTEKDKKTGRETEYQARWHEQTPNAPKENGETWVVTREDKTRKQNDFLLMRDGKELWINTGQSILDTGHIKNREDDYGSKDIGYVTNLEKELEYLVEAKGDMGIKDSEDMEENGFFDKETEDMVEELRLEMIKLFEDAIKKGNEIVYLIDYNASENAPR